MDKNLLKISFIGDIMCEKPLLQASYRGNGKYNFDSVFEKVKPYFMDSDYVVGNLETICAGKEFGYTDHIYSFNTPTEFLKSIKNAGIDMVTTATNHSLDRGVKGLKENIKNLEKYGLDYVGTYLTPNDRKEIFVKDIEGIRLAFLNYTYGTNTHINGEILRDDELFHIGLLKSQKDEIERYNLKNNPKTIKGKLAKHVFKYITLEQWFKIKKVLYKEHNTAYQDNDLSYIEDKYLNQIKKDLKKANEIADYTIGCMHSGGQFHPEPGKFSEFMMNFMDENGADIVIGNHPHVVQRCEKLRKGIFGAYSLGNFSISPSSVYLIHDDLPEYSIMPHFYIDKSTKKIYKATFTILKIVENKNKSLKVYSVIDLYKNENKEQKKQLMKEVLTIYNRFLNTNYKKLILKSEFKLPINL